METLNERIKYVMDTLEYPVNQFAKRLGVNIATVRNIIGAKQVEPRASFIRKIYEIFPVSHEWLIGGFGEPWTKEDISSHKYNEEVGLNVSYKAGVEENVTNRFLKIRQSVGLSQQAFAEKLNISRDVVASIENNRQNVPIYVMQSLIRELSINVNWLVFELGQMTLSKKRDKNLKDQKVRAEFDGE